MAAEIVNLRLGRKRKARAEARTKADANAARHGQTKAERTLRAARQDLEARRLDGHRREDADERE
jgi:hypothetical protein